MGTTESTYYISFIPLPSRLIKDRNPTVQTLEEVIFIQKLIQVICLICVMYMQVSPYVVNQILKQIHDECVALCATSKPSLLRALTPAELSLFSFEYLSGSLVPHCS